MHTGMILKGVTIAPPVGPTTLLQPSDLSVEGVFLSPEISTGGGYTVTHPIAMKVTGSTRTYYILDGAGNVVEFAEPALSPPGTAIGSMNQASAGHNWGPYPAVGNSANATPATTSTFAWGLNYDAQTGYLFLNWSGSYTGLPFGLNNIAAASFGASTLSGVGNWGLNDRSNTVGMPMGASGTINIPAWFVSAYLPAGARLGVGLGGAYGSITLTNSFGPSIEAIPVPAGNAMTPGTDYLLPTGTILMRYANNPVGPTCFGSGVGCTPGTAPTNPRPAQMAFNQYSLDQYADDWDPYSGHGWWNSDSGGIGNWYDDGIKGGIIYSMQSTSGWLNTTISASPAPTISYPNITFTIPTVDFHDGSNLQVGDIIWVQTCTPGDGFCTLADADNGRYLSICQVTSVNAGTGLVGATIQSPDFGSGAHLPVVGGVVFGGVIYAHGTPQPSRVTFLLQIYNPLTLVPVVGGNAYDPVYASELVLSKAGGMVNYFGYPGGATPGVAFPGPQPANVLVDPANRKIIFTYRWGMTNIGTQRSLLVVFSVS